MNTIGRIVIGSIIGFLIIWFAITQKPSYNYGECVGIVRKANAEKKLELAPNNVIYVNIDTLKKYRYILDATEQLEVEFHAYEIRIQGK